MLHLGRSSAGFIREIGDIALRSAAGVTRRQWRDEGARGEEQEGRRKKGEKKERGGRPRGRATSNELRRSASAPYAIFEREIFSPLSP